MIYFLVANSICLIWSIYQMVIFAIQGSKEPPIIAPGSRGERDEGRPKNRFYPDYFYTTGLIYALLCGMLFLSNCLEILSKCRSCPACCGLTIIQILGARLDYYYLLAATGLTIAFFILPDRTRKLPDAQPWYVVLSVGWIVIALLISAFLPN